MDNECLFAADVGGKTILPRAGLAPCACSLQRKNGQAFEPLQGMLQAYIDGLDVACLQRTGGLARIALVCQYEAVSWTGSRSVGIHSQTAAEASGFILKRQAVRDAGCSFKVTVPPGPLVQDWK